MEYKGLNSIRSKYPASEIGEENPYSVEQPTPKPLAENYTKSGDGVVQFTGKYPQNFINFQVSPITNINIADINVIEGPSPQKPTFRFIVNFKEPGQNGANDFWTSPAFYADLQRAFQEGNPYFGFDTVTIAVVNFQLLTNYHNTPEFVIRQNYAEVDILDTITTKEDMLLHINWMVSSDEKLRPVRGLPPIVLPFGEWQLRTSPSLGQEWSEAVKQLDIGDLGFDVTSVPIEGLPPIDMSDFDNSRFTNDGSTGEVRDISDPRSNWDYDYSPRGDSNVDVVTNDGENRSNSDFEGSPRTGDNTDTRTDTTTTDTRSGDTSTRSGTASGTTSTTSTTNDLDYGGRTGGTSTRTSSTSTSTTSTTASEPIAVYSRSYSITQGSTSYFPFTSAGRYVGEIRYSGTSKYVWSGSKWENIG